MPAVCFYFQVHQPYRLRHYTFFDIGGSPFYEDVQANCDIMLKVARKCYLPMNALLLDLIRKHKALSHKLFSFCTCLINLKNMHQRCLKVFRHWRQQAALEMLDETYAIRFLFYIHAKAFAHRLPSTGRVLPACLGRHRVFFAILSLFITMT